MRVCALSCAHNSTQEHKMPMMTLQEIKSDKSIVMSLETIRTISKQIIQHLDIGLDCKVKYWRLQPDEVIVNTDCNAVGITRDWTNTDPHMSYDETDKAKDLHVAGDFVEVMIARLEKNADIERVYDYITDINYNEFRKWAEM